MKRLLVVFAGPNGSGKSTVINSVRNQPGVPSLYICPDEIAKQYQDINDIKERYLKAMREAENYRYLAIEKGLSFMFETVLSTEDKIEFLNYAKNKGYIIEAVYITTKSPDINTERVKQRVLYGEHDVPVDKIQSRYEKSMKLLHKLIIVSHAIQAYDNSFQSPFMVFSKKDNNEIRLLNKEKRDIEVNNWINKYITNPLIQLDIIKGLPLDLDVKQTNDYLGISKEKNSKNDSLIDL